MRLPTIHADVRCAPCAKRDTAERTRWQKGEGVPGPPAPRSRPTRGALGPCAGKYSQLGLSCSRPPSLHENASLEYFARAAPGPGPRSVRHDASRRKKSGDAYTPSVRISPFLPKTARFAYVSLPPFRDGVRFAPFLPARAKDARPPAVPRRRAASRLPRGAAVKGGAAEAEEVRPLNLFRRPLTAAVFGAGAPLP